MIILCLLILYDSKILIDRNLFSVQWVAMLARFEAPDSESTSDSESSSSSVSKPGLKRKHSSSSESGSSSASDVPAKRVDMALSQLYMLDDKQGGPQHESTFAKQGKNRKRVKSALSQGCCKSKCKRKLPFKLLMHMVTVFWSLSKACQDCILWSMQQKDLGDEYEEDSDSGSSSTSSLQHKISWSIEGLECLGLSSACFMFVSCSHHPLPVPVNDLRGYPVCRKAFLQLMGISPARLVRTRKTFKGIDGRKFSFQA